ncbi:hypothetical protein [Aquicella lusitana]|uniref:Uncharacterized protein n=1 Tax=Aquicella lusitana TaxID=254246 RepID=A0A370GGB6_9COXI|nr:hypothetical protein [Aquicella lusitana]RDI42838.1 hypothetical protein C8D86_11235 [Aquicella lusitana]VVC73081.1 hypothetical protein AQULUS_08120 [Aquicella lusitana]
MKQFILMIGAILVATGSIAGISSTLGKNSPQLNALSSAVKASQTMHAQQHKNDITIVYGGADISNRPTLIQHIATA